jgi:hypothetical protein
MDSPAPAERAASQSSDDRLSSLLYLSQQLNAERDLPRLVDLMAREVARLLAAEQAFFCGIAPPTNCSPWWRSKAQVLNKQRGTFITEDEEMLKAVAAQAAIAIETAQLIGGLQQQRDALLVENTQLWQAVEGRYFQQPLLGNSPLIRQVMQLIEAWS